MVPKGKSNKAKAKLRELFVRSLHHMAIVTKNQLIQCNTNCYNVPKLNQEKELKN